MYFVSLWTLLLSLIISVACTSEMTAAASQNDQNLKWRWRPRIRIFPHRHQKVCTIQKGTGPRINWGAFNSARGDPTSPRTGEFEFHYYLDNEVVIDATYTPHKADQMWVHVHGHNTKTFVRFMIRCHDKDGNELQSDGYECDTHGRKMGKYHGNVDMTRVADPSIRGTCVPSSQHPVRMMKFDWQSS